MSLYIYPNPETIQTARMSPVKQGSPTPGWGLVPAQGLLGMGPHQEVSDGPVSRWSLTCCSPSFTQPPEPFLPTLSPWKKCLPWNQSLVPKRLGTTAVKYGLEEMLMCHSGSLIINNGPLWCKTLTVEEGVHQCGGRIRGLCVLPAVNLKLL